MTIPTEAAQADSVSRPKLRELDALIERDRRRKLLAVVPVAGVVGAAVALQATWLLAVVATGVIGVQALRRDR